MSQRVATEPPVSPDRMRSIGFVLIPNFPLMSYAAAIEPLRAANQICGRTLYRWWHASPDGLPVAASSGIAVLPDVPIGAGTDADRVFVCAGGNPSTFDDRRVFNWLRGLSRRGVVIGGISGGPFILARAGLLDGRTCTLHWEHIPAFQESFPRARVARSLFEFDGDRITCSGGTAALDLMLRLIADDHGASLATAVSEWFVHNTMRAGLSPQRMDLHQRFSVREPRILRVLEAIETHIEKPLTRTELAAVGCMSVRQLERMFKAALGRSLHQHYLRERLDQAARLERETVLTLTQIASATGFASAAELRRVQRRTAP